MRFPHFKFPLAVCALMFVACAGCRSGGTSYSVKWARKGDAVAQAETPREKNSGSPPIRQTKASAEDSVADVDLGDEESTEPTSRWASLFGRKDKAKRLQLPRTDLIDDEPVAGEPAFGEF